MGQPLPPAPPAVLRRQFERAVYGDLPTWECVYCGSLHPARTAIPVNKCCNCGAPRLYRMSDGNLTTYACWL